MLAILQIVVVLLGVALASPALAQSSADRLEDHVRYLASPELEGRGNATEGLTKARDYIASQMEAAGLEPAGDEGYLSPLEVVTRVEPARGASLRIGEHVLAEGVEFVPTGFSDAGAVDAQLVFVGYGLSAPALDYDDYKAVDVRGKVVLALSGAPASLRDALRSGPRAYLESPGSKAAVALAKGARAILIVNDPRGHGTRAEQLADTLPLMRPATALDGIAAAYLTEAAAARVLSDTPIDLPRLQRRLDQGEPASRTIDLPVNASLAVQRQRRTIYNCVGMVPGTEGAASEPIVLTAHYDGLGQGSAASLSQTLPAFHPGADDNASGVAVLLETARALAADPPGAHPPLIFAAPAGEELGLRGSRRLARRLVETYGTGTLINFDMLGRLRDQTIHAAPPAEPSPLRSALLDTAQAARLDVQLEAQHARFTDHISFVELGFRGVNLTTGRHVDYHMPGDTLDKLNWSGLSQVQTFVEALVRSLS